jgi:hypothetical protein
VARQVGLPTEKVSPSSWWRVDPRTGTTVGIGGDGSGQAMLDYTQLLYRMALVVCSYMTGASLTAGEWREAAAWVTCTLSAGAGILGYKAVSATAALVAIGLRLTESPSLRGPGP